MGLFTSPPSYSRVPCDDPLLPLYEPNSFMATSEETPTGLTDLSWHQHARLYVWAGLVRLVALFLGVSISLHWGNSPLASIPVRITAPILSLLWVAAVLSQAPLVRPSPPPDPMRLEFWGREDVYAWAGVTITLCALQVGTTVLSVFPPNELLHFATLGFLAIWIRSSLPHPYRFALPQFTTICQDTRIDADDDRSLLAAGGPDVGTSEITETESSGGEGAGVSRIVAEGCGNGTGGADNRVLAES